jgi:hypothetical protein
MHPVKHDVLLVQFAYPAPKRGGVYTLGMELANFADRAAIDSLTSGGRYDENAGAVTS